MLIFFYNMTSNYYAEDVCEIITLKISLALKTQLRYCAFEVASLTSTHFGHTVKEQRC